MGAMAVDPNLGSPNPTGTPKLHTWVVVPIWIAHGWKPALMGPYTGLQWIRWDPLVQDGRLVLLDIVGATIGHVC